MKYSFINNKKIIPIVIAIILVLVVGVSYAFFSYNQVGNKNSQLVTGDVYMHFNETGNEIVLTNAFPETKEEAKLRNDNYMTFTISGKNTTKNKDIYYELKLDEGSEIEGKTRFNPKDLRFELIETIDGVKETVIDGMSYEYFNDHRFYVNTIPNQTNSEIEISYQLRMWISDEVIISDTEENANYTTDVYKNSYASIKVNVYGDFVEKKVPSLADRTLEMLDLDVNDVNDGCPVEGEQITNIAGADVDLICEYSDDDGTSYYFRGASTHNYAKWAGYYWRIIRVNGDGNIRMIYAGDADTIDALSNKQEVLANGYNDGSTDYTQIGTSKFNSSYRGNAYVGLMYGDLPEVYDTVGVVSSDSVTTTTLSTTGAYEYGASYTIDSKDGMMTIANADSILVTMNNISTLVGKYMIVSTWTTKSYDEPLILVESVDSSALTVTGKQITRKLIDGLDTNDAYNQTNENKNYSTIMGEDNSTTQTTLNGWYNTNIKGTEYELQVADSIICNDRSLYKEEYGIKVFSTSTYAGIKSYAGTSSNSGLGIGNEVTGFGGYYRNRNSYAKPSLKCEQKNDRFTVSNSKGNKALVNPIGLISVDEVALAGAKSATSNDGYFLRAGYYYLTSSPSIFYGSGEAGVLHVGAAGDLFCGSSVNDAVGVRPVLSIDPNKATISGIGTWDDPFIFS